MDRAPISGATERGARVGTTATITVKVSVERGDGSTHFRRWREPLDAVTVERLHTRIRSLEGVTGSGPLRYIDDEGTEVVITSAAELAEALRYGGLETHLCSCRKTPAKNRNLAGYCTPRLPMIDG